MPIVYVDEYEPSSASLQVTDPIYKISQNAERITVGRVGIPTASWLVPVVVVGGIITIAWWLTKKS